MTFSKKNIFKSKTFWLNLVGGIVLVASGQVPGINLPTHTSEVVLAVANIINRFFTSREVTIN